MATIQKGCDTCGVKLPSVGSISKTFPNVPKRQQRCAPIARVTPTTPITNLTPDPIKLYGNYKIKVLVIAFLPTSDGVTIDETVTGDLSGSLAQMQAKVEADSQAAIEALELASCYRKWDNPNSLPNVSFQVMGRIEIREPWPMRPGCEWEPLGFDPPLIDYDHIMKRINAKDWVENQGVSQIWLFGYDGGKAHLHESVMSGPYGNISNSYELKGELPIYNKTYTCYTYNLGRGVAEMLEDHTHQLERLFEQVDKDKLFWERFCGSTNFAQLQPANGIYRRGWTHYPPNGTEDYDWQNSHAVRSDFFDWRPDGGGQTRMVTCQDWSCADEGGKTFKILWMQGIPGANSGLTFGGKALTDWWSFYGDFDAAMFAARKLVV